MFHSIHQFQEKGIKGLEDIFSRYTEDLSKIAEMVYGVTDEVTRLGCSMIALLKILYLTMCDITKKWTGSGWNWGQPPD